MKLTPLGSLRVSIFLIALAILAMVLPSSLGADTPAVGTPPSAEAVSAYADQLSQLVQGRKFDELAKQVAPADLQSTKIEQWREHLVSQFRRSDELRGKRYDEEVNKARDYFAKGKFDEAIDKAVAAYLIAKDQPAFLNLDWVKDLTTRAAAQAAKYEKEGRWLESLQLYTDLHSLYELDTRYKPDMQRLARRVRLMALYTPQTLFEMRKAIAAKVEKENPETQPATAPATTEANEPPSFPRWQDHVEGVTVEMARNAIDQACSRWVEGTNYETLLRGGVEALRLFLTTPELAKEFKGLADPAAKDRFNNALDGALAQIKPESPMGGRQMYRILTELLNANDQSIGLPQAVALTEFTDGAMERLDPFTAVIWPREAEEFEKTTKGTFGGIGIQISLENGKLKVISPLEDTPAYAAGIEADDTITSIDGKTTTGITIDQAVHRIMGKPGTQVKLSVKREGKATPIEFSLTRAEIHVASVKGVKRDPKDLAKWIYMIDPESKIGYMRINGFQEDTVREMSKVITSLQSQGARGLILDLRFNPGGLLKAAVEMSNLFLDKNAAIVSTKGLRTRQTSIAADGDTIVPRSFPIIVMVNQYSASASEIFAGAMKDHGRAMAIIGQRSFGKGSVQNVIDIGDKAAIKLTMSYYYLPKGESLHRRDGAKTWGVEPDITVEMTPTQVGALMKDRREREIIARNGGTTTSAPASQAATTSASTKASEPLIDTQLDTALFVMRLQLEKEKAVSAR